MKDLVVIVGAGISAATICAVLRRKYRILVLEQRDHIGGNCYDYRSNGTYIHKYGAHIYHTTNPDLHTWLCQFTTFEPYRHVVHAEFDPSKPTVPFPYSLETEAALGRSLSDDDILEMFFKGYSHKMWGTTWEHLPASIRNRVPKRLETSDFFPGQIVGMPTRGYTSMMENMFDGCEILTSVPVHAWMEYIPHAKIIFYCGRLDTIRAPSNLCLGSYSAVGHMDLWLKHVTLQFDWHCGYDTHHVPAGVVNICHTKKPMTRIVYHAKITGGASQLYHVETPVHMVSVNDPVPLYPHYAPEYRAKHEVLVSLLKQYYPHVVPVGRLATYKYLDMYQAIGAAKSLAERYL